MRGGEREREREREREIKKKETVHTFLIIQTSITVFHRQSYIFVSRKRERVRESERVSISRNTIKRGDRPIRER